MRVLVYNRNMSIEIDLAKLLRIGEQEAKNLVFGVGLSGGRDSVALLHLLRAAGYRVAAINVEHGIRGEESVSDSRFVKALCDSWDVPLFAFSVDAPTFAKENGYTLEQGARALRYRVFEGLLAEGKCDYIALAHHLDDQVETVLMRILRGTGIRGLVGMRAVNGKYIRPLLDVSREEINRYVAQNKLEFREDSTNGDSAYTRNFLRGELGVLRTRFPALSEAMARLSSNARETEDFLDSLVPEVELKDGEAYVRISDCDRAAIAKRLVVKAASLLGAGQDIEERHFPLVFSLLNAENGKRIELTHSLDAHRQGDYLVFALRGHISQSGSIPFGEGAFEDFGIRVDVIAAKDVPKLLKADGSVLYLDADSIPSDAVIRRRRQGDKICKFGGGSKSLGDFLTDKKIPKRKREGLAVVASGGDVLAVAGVDISSRCKLTADTSRAYRITLLKK